MKKFFTLIAVAAMAFAAQANELTVCDNGVVGEDAWGGIPVYGYWYDAEGMAQQIYPADMLTEMAGGKITQLKFYSAASWGAPYDTYTIAFQGGEILLALKEVEQTAFADEDPMIGGATVVASVEPEYGGLYLTFTLDEPFEYNGGNLLVECFWDGSGSWGTTYFLGEEMEENTAYVGYDHYGSWDEGTFNALNKCTFTYESGTTPVEPVTVGAPVFNGYTIDGVTGYGVDITPTTEGSEIMYRVLVWDPVAEEWVLRTDWTLYGDTEGEIWFENNGEKVRVEAYAFIGENRSEDVAYEFTVATALDELMSGKTVAGVRYFNMAGQEMQQAEGLTIVVTTYTDGTTNAVKVVK